MGRVLTVPFRVVFFVTKKLVGLLLSILTSFVFSFSPSPHSPLAYPLLLCIYITMTYTVGGTFMQFQWDILLIEVGLATVFRGNVFGGDNDSVGR